MGAEGALGLVTTVFTACCIASQLMLDEEASVDCGLPEKLKIEIITNKARQNLIDAKCRWRYDRLHGAGSFREPLGQTKVMQIRQRGDNP